MFNINCRIISTEGQNETKIIKVNRNTKIEDLKVILDTEGDHLRFFHENKYLRDPINWDSIINSRENLIVFNSLVPMLGSKELIEEVKSIKNSQMSNNKEIIDAKNINYIKTLACTKYQFDEDKLKRFIKYALISTELLHLKEEFDDFMESPYVSKLVKDREC